MTKPIIKLVNAETGEEIEREMNAQEMAQWEADKTAANASSENAAKKAAEKSILLEKLGITNEEAQLLLS